LLANTASAFVSIESAVWGAALGYASLWLIHHVFLLVRKKEGLGYGDFKLLAAIGAWLGVEALPWVLFGAASVGALVGIGGILFFKRPQDAPLPFGPFLSAAGFGAVLLGF
jgi:leader peptidase (prepilin peptidase)/N-methyltransferase